jgi:polysaccharide pyruvyl transferase WcaK-like protein
MRVLVDHGSSIWNLGDAAMLDGAVRRLLALAPDIEAHVLAASNHVAPILEAPRVHRVEAAVTGPLFGAPRVVRSLHGSTGGSALGNTAAYFALLGLLMRAAPARVQLGDGRCRLRDFCDNYEALHLVGGGYLNDVFPRELWRKVALMRAFQQRRRPVVLTGQQVGPFRSRLTEGFAASALRPASLFALRESRDSVDLCARWGIPAERRPVSGDDSFGLQAAAALEVEALLARHGLAPGRFIAVNARVDFYGFREAQLERFARLLLELSDRLDIPLAFVPIAVGEGPASDETTGRRLQERLGSRLRLVSLDPSMAALAKALLGSTRAAIGTSYHFCTFALSGGRPAACVSSGAYYGQKARGLSAFWGERIDFDLDGLPPAALAREISDGINAGGLEARLAVRAREAASEWSRMFEGPVQRALRGGPGPKV